MRSGELLLHHQKLEERVRALNGEIEHLVGRLERDPELEQLVLELEEARERLQRVNLELREMEREVEDHRARARARESELMSGRVRNPTELMQMSEEVEHSKARLRAEEDRELEVMAGVEEAEAEVARRSQAFEAAREAREAALPGERRRLELAQGELAAAERERDETWQQVPTDYQAAYRRLQPRLLNPVAEVVGASCGACRVGLTAAELQQVRRGEQLLHCQSCNRLLVAV